MAVLNYKKGLSGRGNMGRRGQIDTWMWILLVVLLAIAVGFALRNVIGSLQ